MIKETEYVKVVLDNPWLKKGNIIHCSDVLENLKCRPEDFPDIFKIVYDLGDGGEACLGDLVWRSKNYEVKSVIFTEVHLHQQTPVFSSRESCEKWLEKNAKNISKELLKQNRSSSFQTLKSWVEKLNNLDELTYNELILIREGINKSIENIEKL